MNIEKCARTVSQKIGKISLSSVTEYLWKEKGYRVLYIGTASGDDAIQKYNLQIYTKRKAFTYSDKQKYVFLHEEYNYDDKLSLLLHELGHIELGHLSAVYEPDSVNMERYAEVFAYFMQHPHKSTFVKMIVSVIVTTLLCFGIFAFVSEEQQTNNLVRETQGQTVDNSIEYVYVTPAGEKYHTAYCSHASLSSKKIDIKKARRKYDPCSVCNPDNN